jgi:pimeloyl-ACP methyl ester carboxylesterase
MAATDTRTIQGAKLEIERLGKGAPLLLLLSEEEQLDMASPFVAGLAEKHSLVVPHYPGFGRSERPEWVSSPDDISYMLLELLDAEGLRGVPVVGLSLGGWIALEMAVKERGVFSKLALVDPLGVKHGGPFDRDIQDIWTSHPSKVSAWKWRDAEKSKRDFASMPEELVSIHARNIESFARFCWEPYMHNPKLKRRLGRVTSPTLIVWGENDGMVTPAYGRAYAEALPRGEFAVIAEAGHYPQIEQPAATLAKVAAFLG